MERKRRIEIECERRSDTMRIMAWLRDLIDGTRSRPLRNAQQEMAGATGDNRGRYGFGRRAHRPDPKGQYGFENDANHQAHHHRG